MVTKFEAEMIASMARGIVDDMQAGLFRSGYSSIIRESHDASCAVLLDDGSLAAQKFMRGCDSTRECAKHEKLTVAC